MYTMTPLQYKLTSFQFGTSVRLRLYLKISSFLQGGVPLDDILRTLSEKYEARTKGDPNAKVMREISASMANGMSFSDALRLWAPASEVTLIQAGEATGDLVPAFNSAIKTTESAQKMKKTIVGKLSYPLVLILALFGLVYMFSTQAIPPMAEVLDPEKWPPSAKALYDFAMFVKTKWWVVLLGLVAFGFVIGKSVKSYTGSARKYLDKVPPWSIYQTFNSSVFLISLSALMKNGTDIHTGIKKIRDMSSSYIANHLDIVLDNMANGISIGKSFKTGFLNRDTELEVEVYSEATDIKETMGKIGENAIEEAIEKITKSAGLMNVLALGSVTGYIAWSYLAFNGLTQSLGSGSGLG